MLARVLVRRSWPPRQDERRSGRPSPNHGPGVTNDGLRRLSGRGRGTPCARDRGTRTRRGSPAPGRLLCLSAGTPGGADVPGCRSRPRWCKGAMGVLRHLERPITRSEGAFARVLGLRSWPPWQDERRSGRTSPNHRPGATDDGLRQLSRRGRGTPCARDRGTQTRRGPRTPARPVFLLAGTPGVASAPGCRSRPRWG